MSKVDTGVGRSTHRFWFRNLNPAERRTFWACLGGWASDALDVQVYSLVLPLLLATGFLHSTFEAGTISTVTLLSSAFGGWLAGILADRYGRTRLLQITVAWFAVFTLLCAFAQDPVQLGVLRALMGLGFGGEWAVGAVLMAEIVRPDYRGRAVGTVQSGWAIGWAVAVGLFVAVSLTFPADLAWRVLFGMGVLPAFLVIYLRRTVPEPTNRQLRNGSALGAALQIFKPALARRTFLCCLIGVGAQGSYYAMATWLPKFLADTRGLNLYGLGLTLALIIVGSFVGYLLGAWLSDAVGRRRTLLIGAFGGALVVVPIVLFNTPSWAFTLLCFPLGLFSVLHFSALGPLFSEQFPTEVRATGQGFCYNFGRGVGALFPAAVGILADRMGLAGAIGIFVGFAYVVLCIGALAVREHPTSDLIRADETESSR
ncbi:UNVERIFIED_ORG: MFS family permease [Arthrobacter globiformis]|nr:MFS family permease [Arthrobacter globiformis]